MRIFKSSGRVRAFTLLEVLIGVLVLALALLGLAAVFPVVVRTQRIARDTVVGTGVLNAAETMLRNHELVRDNSRGLPALITRISQAPQAIRTMWEVSLNPGAPVRYLYTDGGAIRFTQTGPTLLPSDRLNLMPGSSPGTDPTLVWDVAMCLAEELDAPGPPVGGVLDGTSRPDSPPVRMAIFVRRIDPQIRVRTGQTVLGMIDAGTVVPIGSTLPQFGDPTLDGTGSYSVPMFVTVTRALQSRTGGPFDILQVDMANNPRLSAARAIAQSGQLLVDNLGGVHSVLRNVKDAAGNPVANQVLLEKGMLASTAELANNASRPVQLVFTAQVPAAVRVITYRP